MSSRVSPGSGGRKRRKMVLEVDLNAPPCEDFNEVGASSNAPIVQQVLAGHQQGSLPQLAPIDVDSLDDDVVLSSPRAFAAAINNSRRTRGRNNVVDVELVEFPGGYVQDNRSKRPRVSLSINNQPIINCDSYINLEITSHNVRLQTPPPPPEPTFSCPVCMGPLVEEMTTKCGHIFCKGCIKQAITAQNKCPTCRRKVTMKDIIRVYLPATS